MAMKLTVEDILQILKQAASDKGRETTKVGRRVFRDEIIHQLERIASTPESEEDAPRSDELMVQARALIDYLENRGIFKEKSRVGYVVARNTIDLLKDEHAKTSKCWLWPFC